MQEEWKVIEAKGNYKVSNFGRIENANGISCGHMSDGYMTTKIDGKTKSIHRLVAKYFIPNPDDKPDINHKDLNKANNHIDNLEWATEQENSIHLAESGGHCSNNRITEKDVQLIKLMLLEKLPHHEIAKYFNVTRPCISLIAIGKRWLETEIPKSEIEISNLKMEIQKLKSEIEKRKSESKIEKVNFDGRKLKHEDVKEIKRMILKGYTNPEIAIIFNVTTSCISSIRTGAKKSHIQLDECEIAEILSSLPEPEIKEREYKQKMKKEKVIKPMKIKKEKPQKEPNRMKLNAEKVREIKKLLATGDYTHKQIAEAYNVARPNITYIANGQRWSEVTIS